jgi:hypothetical protein
MTDYRPLHIFLAAAAAGLLWQGYFWHHTGLIDESMWITQAQYVQSSDARQYDIQRAYAYPGTPLVTLTVAAHRLGADYIPAIHGSVALLSSFSIAVIAWLCYILRPHNAWWLAAAGLTLFHPMFLLATPPSLVATPLIAATFLLTWLLYERTPISIWPYVAWGCTYGLAAATRLDIAAAALPFLIFFLWPKNVGKKYMFMLGAAALTFSLLDPFMWAHPLGHLLDIARKVAYHSDKRHVSGGLDWPLLMREDPLGFISIIIVSCIVALRRAHVYPIRLYIALAAFTISIFGLLSFAPYAPAWYFFPVLLPWELLLALVLLPAEAVQPSDSYTRRFIYRYANVSAVALLLFLQYCFKVF